MTSETLANDVASAIRLVPDFPRPGIRIRDISPVVEGALVCSHRYRRDGGLFSCRSAGCRYVHRGLGIYLRCPGRVSARREAMCVVATREASGRGDSETYGMSYAQG